MKFSFHPMSVLPLLGALLLPAFAAAGQVYLPGIGGNLNVPVVSYKEQKFQRVLKQQYDFSCGSAALASLLTFHYDDAVSEQQVFQEMFNSGDQERIRRQGFSLLDMKRFLEARGYRADGFRIPLETLAEKAQVPAIVLVNTKGYRHFVLIKGVSKHHVLVGDPALGVRAIPRAAFEQSWDGLIFLIRSHADIGRRHFNRADDWAAKVRAPSTEPFAQQSIANFTLFLPQPMRD